MLKLYDFGLGCFVVTDIVNKRFAIAKRYNFKDGEIEKWKKVTKASINKYLKPDNRGFDGYVVGKYILNDFSDAALYRDEQEEVAMTYINSFSEIEDVYKFFREQHPLMRKIFSELKDVHRKLTNSNFTIGLENKVWEEIYKHFRDGTDISYEMEFKNVDAPISKDSNINGITPYIAMNRSNGRTSFNVCFRVYSDGYSVIKHELVGSFSDYEDAKALLNVITGDNYKDYQIRQGA